MGTRSCIYIFVLLQKQEYILQRDWSCLAEAPPMTRIRICCVVNFTREWREFLARMKRVNSKCSSVQLRVNSTIYSRHSRLVWTHLKSCPDTIYCYICVFFLSCLFPLRPKLLYLWRFLQIPAFGHIQVCIFNHSWVLFRSWLCFNGLKSLVLNSNGYKCVQTIHFRDHIAQWFHVSV